MSTSIPSLASALAPSFTGVSKFGSSLQQVLARAVAIASLPLDSLNAGLTTFNNRQSALGGLNSAFSSVQQSVASLQHALSSSLLNSSISDAGIVGATVGAGAAAGTYSVEVVNIGAFSTAISSAGAPPVTNPATKGITSSATLALSVGSSSVTITPASTSLQDLANAINSQAGTKVSATLVNLGSSSSPDYRLSLRSANLGSDAIDLKDVSNTSLITSSTAGALASYKVDGLPDAVTSTSRAVTLAPGLTVNLLSQSTPGKATTITVSDSPTGLASAFSSFAQSYNTAVDAINQNHGQAGGALQGDSILQSLTRILHKLGTYDNGAPSSALANYGITLDKSGHLNVDAAAFGTAANAGFPALLATLGSATGGGFLKAATDLLNGAEDPITGSITSEITTVASEITARQTKIGNEQALINTLQTSLTARISKADSAIAALESQVSYVTGLFGQFTGATNTQNNGLSTL